MFLVVMRWKMKRIIANLIKEMFPLGRVLVGDVSSVSTILAL